MKTYEIVGQVNIFLQFGLYSIYKTQDNVYFSTLRNKF